MFSGEMDGYLEPCGCAGLENQLGGLKRRHTLIKQLEARGWPVAALDMGGLVRRLGPQAEVKYRYGLESLIKQRDESGKVTWRVQFVNHPAAVTGRRKIDFTVPMGKSRFG